MKNKRTDSCGALRSADEGREVSVAGWVQSSRDHGGVIFIDLRDAGGIVQAVFDPSRGSPHSLAEKLKSEWVVSITGKVVKREPAMVNKSMPTGEIEIVATEAEILNTSPELPFPVEDSINADEPVRMKYRFLDLRRPSMREAVLLRHRVSQAARLHLESSGFAEIETPVLTKATPEGARDFVVPCRFAEGQFYALPQSPQILKQILMASGFERYYQIARCFRDEDLRADRQPEFSQIDLEMAFADEADIMAVVEGLLQKCFGVAGIKTDLPFERIDYTDAVERYGNDRPDMRFGLELCDVSAVFEKTAFKVFASALERGGIVKAIAVEGGDSIGRKDIDELTEEAVSAGAGGLAWIRIADSVWHSPIAKFLSGDEKNALLAKTAMADSKRCLIFFGAGPAATVNAVLSAVRLSLARRLNLTREGEHKFVWVEKFPLFEREPGGRLKAVHHPFTAPSEDSFEKIENAPETLLSRAFDIVLNGVELGGGSVRIHTRQMQEAVLKAIGMGAEEAEKQFGFLLKALEFGAPPHGGVALGLDRLAMMISGRNSIREVTAFPKTQRGMCPLTGAPSAIDSEQMAELGLRKIERE